MPDSFHLAQIVLRGSSSRDVRDVLTSAVDDRAQSRANLFHTKEATMLKQKSAKPQPKSNGHHEVKSAKAQPKANGHQDAHVLPGQRRNASAGRHEQVKFRGALEEFNFSQKGGIEGFLLHSDGQTVQVNVTPDVGFAVVRGIGQNVEATVEPDSKSVKHGERAHPVYSLVTLNGTDGRALIHAGGGESEMATVEGIVKRINFSRSGVPNGVVLESGDFIHLEPVAMKRAGLMVGDKVTAEGNAALMPLGQRVIEAKTVNGAKVVAKRPVRSRSRDEHS